MPRVTIAQDARRLRLGAYPAPGDQLDAIWKELAAIRAALDAVAATLPPAAAGRLRAALAASEGAAMAAGISAIKQRWPKPAQEGDDA